ncbi:MAG: 16S rRNA (guanine(527)-N(7))-methyltransferase RsmG [Candidatus Accumulibacter sp.]|jgi:16S rRNA (guanine527-N7)-methyltransferase|nr:16S rRNA (guanine(527)-N(7))-methyltransferase RsmG [Accumulibacter sp.]
MTNPADRLARGLAALGLELPAERREKLLGYLALLYKWNRAYRLTAVKEAEAIEHHLLDSLAILPHVPAGRLLDVGSGGGAPGVPLAIARPALAVTLLDANSKKAAFLRQTAIELKLENVAVHEGRVERYRPAEGYAAIVSRAFADLPAFVALTKHLLAENGVWLAMKGARPDEELARLPPDIHTEAAHPLTIPGLEEQRHLIVLRRAGEAD